MWCRFVIGCVVVVAIWAASGYFVHTLGPAERGTFGDMFGAVNSLFTGLAFWAVVVTLWQQQRALAVSTRLTSLNLLLERVNRLIASTEGTVHPLEIQQRQQWFQEREGYVTSIREIEQLFGR